MMLPACCHPNHASTTLRHGYMRISENLFEIERRSHADPVEIRFEPGFGPTTPALEEQLQIGPFSVELAGRRQILQLDVRMNQV